MLKMGEMLQSTLTILFYALEFFFDLWPIAVLSPLKFKKNALVAMFSVWIFVAIARVVIIFNPEPIPNILIPEPLNTLLFIVVGVGLFAGSLLNKRRLDRQFQKKANQLKKVEDFLTLSPREFEDMIVELYQTAGHVARRIGKAGDHGVDIEVTSKSGEKWVEHCKRWRGSVGEPIVRDFYGVVQHEKADKGIIFTTGKFSSPAYNWARGKPLNLYDGAKLVELWSRSRASAGVAA
ncbi:MAG: restriction endonuclease [Anaerolineae bacterium]